MSTQDATLSASLQKLHIEPINVERVAGTSKNCSSNPFMRRKRSKSLSSIQMFGNACVCGRKSSSQLKNAVSFKSTSKKILRDPILDICKICLHRNKTKLPSRRNRSEGSFITRKGTFKEFFQSRENDFKSIVKACQQLSLANVNDGVQNFTRENVSGSSTTNISPTGTQCVPISTCSHQARITVTPPCDVTMDELASYFETFVHIPKKMSSMAEMMYI